MLIIVIQWAIITPSQDLKLSIHALIPMNSNSMKMTMQKMRERIRVIGLWNRMRYWVGARPREVMEVEIRWMMALTWVGRSLQGNYFICRIESGKSLGGLLSILRIRLRGSKVLNFLVIPNLSSFNYRSRVLMLRSHFIKLLREPRGTKTQ